MVTVAPAGQWHKNDNKYRSMWLIICAFLAYHESYNEKVKGVYKAHITALTHFCVILHYCIYKMSADVFQEANINVLRCRPCFKDILPTAQIKLVLYKKV